LSSARQVIPRVPYGSLEVRDTRVSVFCPALGEVSRSPLMLRLLLIMPVFHLGSRQHWMVGKKLVSISLERNLF